MDIFDLVELNSEGSNWSEWRAQVEQAIHAHGLQEYLAGTVTHQDRQHTATAEWLVACSLPDSILVDIFHLTTAHELWQSLCIRFAKSTVHYESAHTTTEEARESATLSISPKQPKVNEERSRCKPKRIENPAKPLRSISLESGRSGTSDTQPTWTVQVDVLRTEVHGVETHHKEVAGDSDSAGSRPPSEDPTDGTGDVAHHTHASVEPPNASSSADVGEWVEVANATLCELEAAGVTLEADMTRLSGRAEDDETRADAPASQLNKPQSFELEGKR